MVQFEGKLYRLAQDCDPRYGSQLRAFEITRLSTTEYQEKAVEHNPILQPSGTGWNRLGMHHLNPHEIAPGYWIGCVDGFDVVRVFGSQY